MEDNSIKLSIVTPYGLIFDGEAKSVVLPGVEGEFGVLRGHCSFLSLLKVGVIDIEFTDNTRELIAINWGYAKINETSVDILANGAVAIVGKSEGEISKAITDAKTLIKEAAADETLISSVISKIDSGRQS